MRLLFILFSILLYTIYGHSQSGSIFGEINYNTFSHSSLKSFQQEFVNDIPDVSIKVNDNFPAHIGFTIGYKINSMNTSLFASYNSTGGKISYSDFSGVIRLIQPLEGYTLGGMYQINLSKLSKNDHEFYVGFKGFITYSRLTIESFNQILDSINEDSLRLYSNDFGVGVNFVYEYPVGFFKIRALIGLDAVLGGKLLFKENSEFHLEDNSGDAIRTGWTGLRTGIGISIPI